ncbi:MAG: hypothetical protein JST55_00975 [Bacteroidetes bacterium]|nr:hypothetical protein [Bacteroidota bacterium]
MTPKHKKWLSQETNFIFNQKHPLNKKESLKSILYLIFDILKSPKGAWFIFLLVLASYSLCLIDFKIPTIFYLNLQESISILDGRLGNLVTLFSITITVFVFIINAMQNRRKNEELFSTIFEESKLYPIVYFILSNIAIMFFISFFRDKDRLLFFTEDELIRIVVLFLYFTIISILAIGYLFYKIYQFLTSDLLDVVYSKKLIFLLKKELKRDLIIRMSKNVYRESLQQISSFFKEGVYSLETNQYDFIIPYKQNQIIKDTNLKNLHNFLKKIPYKTENNGSYLYNSIGLNETIYKNNLFFRIPDKSLLSYLQRNYKKIFKIETGQISNEEFQNLKKSILARLKNSINSKEVEKVKKTLSLIMLIYQEFANEISTYGNEIIKNKYSNISFFLKEWNIINDLDIDIYNAFEKAAKSDDSEILDAIYRFIISVLSMSIPKRTTEIYSKYIFFINRIYYLLNDDKKLQQQYANRSIRNFYEIVKIYLNIEYRHEDVKSRENLPQFYYDAFYALSGFLKTLIDNNEIELLKNTLRKFKEFAKYDEFMEFKYKMNLFRLQLSPEKNVNEILKVKKYREIAEEIVYNFNSVLFGLKAWLFYLYKNTLISETTLDLFLECFEETNYENEYKLNALIKESRGTRALFDMDAWGNEELRASGEVYTPKVNPSAWLTFTWIIYIIKYGFYSLDNINQISSEIDFKFLSESVKVQCDEITQNYDKWQKYLGGIDEVEFNERSKNLILLFDNLKKRYEEKIELEITELPVSETKVSSFKQSVFESWNKNNLLHKFFELYKNLSLTDDNSIKLKNVGFNRQLCDEKKYFIENFNLPIGDFHDFGGSLAQSENEYFFELIFKEKEVQIFDSVLYLLDSMIEFRKNKNLNTTLIIMGYDYKFYDNDIQNSIDFLPGWKEKRFDFEEYVGSYKNIPIFRLDSHNYNSKYIFSDFEKAFKKVIKIDPNYFEDLFDINVTIVDAKTIDKDLKYVKDQFSKNLPLDWSLDATNKLLSDEKLIIKIKQDIIIKIIMQFDLYISDLENYDLAFRI